MGFLHGTDLVELDNFTAFSGAGGFAKLQQAMTQVGNNVLLDLGGGETLTFAGAVKAQFTASDFALPMNLAGFQLTFDDEFNTFNASPDGLATTWRTTGTTLGHELEHYSSTVGAGGPFSLANGILDIAATPVSSAAGLPYTSGEITTQRSFAQTYGYFEMRAELPAGQGMWPAFWLLPADGSWPPELDVMEMLGNNPGTIYTTTHSKVASTAGLAIQVADTSAGFHSYGVDWEPDRVTFYFDGNAISSLATPADMNKPMYMLVNLAVGGAGSWPGAAVGESGHLLVDYVRAYASPTAVQPPLILVNAGESIRKGDGSFSITGTGWNGWITLGNGNQTIQLTGAAGTSQGSGNTIVTGNGNQSIAVVGNYNTITTGNGTSVIDAGGSYARVTIGATPSGTTVIKAAGYAEVVTATGNGNVSLSGTTGLATVTLLDGNDTLTLGGNSNTVTIGRGTSVIVSGTGNAIVHTGGGASTISAGGWTNLLDAGSGMNFLHGGLGNDTFVLNGAGQGLDTITGFINNDVLDFTRALSGLPIAADLSNIGLFVSTQVQGTATTILIDPTGTGGSAQAVASLVGVNTSLAGLLAHGCIHVGVVV
jgi:beta-glucanase (GH16 family)